MPVVAAPMAGGPSTPALVDAVSSAGGLGFLAAGYRTVAQVRAQLRELATRQYGLNVFVPGPRAPDVGAVAAYRDSLRSLAARLGVEPGEPGWDDDGYPAKVALCAQERVPVVSFTFGCPAEADVRMLHEAGSTVLVTVTGVAEAQVAREAGADGLIVQGEQAGGHAGGWLDLPPRPLDALLAEVVPVGLPVVAAGGLMGGNDVARVLAAGAVAAQLGTAFLLCPEAGTSAGHRRALQDPSFGTTERTRAFTGRPARALLNAFVREHRDAPAGYPEVHAVTAPLRRAAAAAGDLQQTHLWAGAGWRLARSLPAAKLVAALEQERRACTT